MPRILHAYVGSLGTQLEPKSHRTHDLKSWPEGSTRRALLRSYRLGQVATFKALINPPRTKWVRALSGDTREARGIWASRFTEFKGSIKHKEIRGAPEEARLIPKGPGGGRDMVAGLAAYWGVGGQVGHARELRETLA